MLYKDLTRQEQAVYNSVDYELTRLERGSIIKILKVLINKYWVYEK